MPTAITAITANTASTTTARSKLRIPALCALLLAATPAGAGDPVPPACDELEWIPTFGGSPGTSSPVYAMVAFDDGSGGGPAIYAAGIFQTAGGVSANRIAKWNGTEWSPLGSGITGSVYALTVFDDGSGEGLALYAGGEFTMSGGVTVNRIAKWNGTDWSPLGSGMNGTVRALTAFDDGSGGGPALYAGGEFTTAGGVLVNRIAKWNGTAWSALGSGMNGTVHALTVFDDGSGGGAALCAGGGFTTAGGAPANRITKWNGTAWSPLGAGMDDEVLALAALTGGSGGAPVLCAGGRFMTAGGVNAQHVARWNGTAWSSIGGGMSNNVLALAVFDDGSGGGPALYAGGSFLSAGVSALRIAKWNGTAWSSVGGGTNEIVYGLAALDDGSGDGPALYAGGLFTGAGNLHVNHIAKWDGTAWSPLGMGLGGTSSAFVGALASFDDGSGGGAALYAAGEFSIGSGVTTRRIAKWNGTAWSPLGMGFGGGIQPFVRALAVFDDGSSGGPLLYAGGGFTTADGLTANRIAKWNGTAWTPLSSGMNDDIWALAIFNNGAGGGSALYAGGEFTTAGGVTANRIAKWNGTAWSPLGSGVNGTVRALTVFDDGTGGGPALYAGGDFTTAGGVTANRTAKWNGSTWTPLGAGVNNTAWALAVFDDGSGDGPSLHAGGNFTTAGGVSANRVAKWNGTGWWPLGSGMNNLVRTLTIFDDGTGDGPAFYAGGTFTTAGGVTANRIAKWDGTAWSPLGDGLSQSVNASAIFDDGSGRGVALCAGGAFQVSPAGDSYLAKWGCVDPARPPCAAADLNCDGFVDGNDLTIVLGGWGPCGSPPCIADINDDGVIDGNDLAIVLGAWTG